MKNLDNVLKPLGERISSPLYSTFLISWCVSNWKIFYVTFIIPPDHLSASKLDYIQSYLGDYCHMWIYPALFTGLFIFLFPRLEKEVLKFWYKNKADRKKIIVERLEQSPVSSEEHRALLMKYVQRESDLTTFFQKEGAWLAKKDELTSLYNEALKKSVEDEQRISGMTETISRFQSRTDIKQIFKDRWKLTYKSHNDEFGHGEEYFFITHQNEYQLETDNTPKYKVVYFFYDQIGERVYMLKERVDEHNPEFFFNDLLKIDEVTYEGREFGIRKANDYTKPVYMVYSVTYRKSGTDGPIRRKVKDVILGNSY